MLALELERICRALRSIGLMRTRGLGAVKCSLIETEEENHFIIKPPETIDLLKRYTIHYKIRLEETLMISGMSNEKTNDYISGVNVLGNLAKTYLEDKGTGKEFQELFLQDKVWFSNLYLQQGDEISKPAPLFLGKIKAGNKEDGKIVSLLETHSNFTVKPLKKSYITKSMRKCEVSKENVYHHRRREEPLLYTQQCLSAGQFFAGTIECDGTYVETLLTLLNKNGFRFGRSKTAQYSKCSLVSGQVSEKTDEFIEWKAGELVLLALESDLFLLDDYGNFSITKEALLKKVASFFALPKESKIILKDSTVLQDKIIGGYQAKWNLRKPMIRALAMGSVLIFEAPVPLQCKKRAFLGVRQNEGYGQICFYRKEEIKFDSKKEEVSKVENIPNELEQVRCTAIAYAEQHKTYFTENGINAAFVGRVTLMLKQAEDQEDFSKRVASIASKEKRELIQQIIQSNHSNQFWRDYYLVIFTLGKYFLKQQKEG